mgnify:CR=1 FL=1|tara:strand:+ start:19513 stop:21495 length:1983 start_codon:yes stop_codon:yes gene_type:complete
MSKSLFYICWFFLGVGLLPFYNLHHPALIAVFCTIWALALIIFAKNVHLPKALRTILLISGGVFVWQDYDGFRSVEAAAALFSVLAALKLYEIKTARDYFLFFLIFQLMMIAQYLLLESLLLLAFMVIATTLMCGIFMDLQRDRRVMESIFQKSKRKVLFRVMSFSLILTILLFFIFPRANFTLFRSQKTQTVNAWTGFSSELRPGSISEIMQSDLPVFRARFSNRAPPMPEMYWQGGTLSVTDGFNWTKNNRLRYLSAANQESSGRYEYIADMAELGGGSIFLLAPAATYKLLTLGQTSRRGLGDAIVSPLSHQKIRWRGSSDSTDFLKNEPIFHQDELQLPPEVRAYIRETYPQFKGLTLDQLQREIYLLFSKDFSYSLSPGEYNGSPLEQLKEFLEVRKIGICEHFASAMALILRSFDYPAHVMVGFQGGDFNELGEYWLIRGRDAHAWVSVHDSNGWRRLDPTSYVVPNRLIFGATEFGFNQEELAQGTQSWLRAIRSGLLNDVLKVVDSTFYSLNLAFINYSAESQQEFLSSLGLKNWKRSWLKWVCALIAFVFITTYWLYTRRNGRSPWHVVNRSYQTFIKKLHNLDLNVDQAMPPYRLVEVLQRQGAGSATIGFVHSYTAIKYASTEVRPNKVQLRQLKVQLSLALQELKGMK